LYVTYFEGKARQSALGVSFLILCGVTRGNSCFQITVLNAGRKYLGTEDLAGRVFVTSGLGGMSGAQPKAAVIAGCIGVIAEVALTTNLFFLFSGLFIVMWAGMTQSV
jgi:hypothetical protein